MTAQPAQPASQQGGEWDAKHGDVVSLIRVPQERKGCVKINLYSNDLASLNGLGQFINLQRLEVRERKRERGGGGEKEKERETLSCVCSQFNVYPCFLVSLFPSSFFSHPSHLALFPFPLLLYFLLSFFPSFLHSFLPSFLLQVADNDISSLDGLSQARQLAFLDVSK